jgi:hypothetical protein
VLADGQEAIVEQRYIDILPPASAAGWLVPILMPSFRLVVTDASGERAERARAWRRRGLVARLT